MNISGIRPLGGFYDNNSITIQSHGLATKSAAPAISVASSDSQSPASLPDAYSESRSRQTFGKYDYASQYKPNQTFSLKGADSSLESLDVSTAVDSMQRDSALHQYQYFVTASAVSADTPSIRGSENFTL